MKDIVVSPLPTLDCLSLFELIDLALTPGALRTPTLRKPLRSGTDRFFEADDSLVVSLETVGELLNFYLLGHPGQTRRKILQAFIPSLRLAVANRLDEKVAKGTTLAVKEGGRTVYRSKMPSLDELAKKIRGE